MSEALDDGTLADEALSPPRTGRVARWNGALICGAGLSAVVAVTALLSLVWTPHDPTAMRIAERLAAPSLSHPFGTDDYGRDGLSLVMAGARTALAVALAACGIGLGFGVPLGLVAAARGGWMDEAAMRLNDLVFGFPALLLAMLLAATLGPGALDAVIAIGVYSTPVFARVVRTGARRIWSLDYALAARVAGEGPWAVSIRHVLPNMIAPLAVQASLQLSLAVVAEAGLAYVGLSAQPPQPSWGRMLADAQTLYTTAPWLAAFPGGAIMTTVLGFSLFGEGLRARFSRPGDEG